MVLSDCSGLKFLFESDANLPQVVHRWQEKLLQYQFVICHRPGMMMWECKILSRYNKATELWSNNDVDNASTKVSLEEYSEMVKTGVEHQPVIIFTK